LPQVLVTDDTPLQSTATTLKFDALDFASEATLS